MNPRLDRFEEIYEAYSGAILAYAMRRTADAEDAADVVAETFTVAWRRLHDVPHGAEARPWLYGVARRVLANHHRGERRRLRLSERAAAELSSAAAVAGPDAAPVADPGVADAFAALGEADRELLTLVGWDGLSPAEAATALGVTAAVVRVRLHRARRRFARLLAANGVQRHEPAGHGTARWAPAHPDPEDTR